jgi:hypothetical protein
VRHEQLHLPADAVTEPGPARLPRRLEAQGWRRAAGHPGLAVCPRPPGPGPNTPCGPCGQPGSGPRHAPGRWPDGRGPSGPAGAPSSPRETANGVAMAPQVHKRMSTRDGGCDGAANALRKMIQENTRCDSFSTRCGQGHLRSRKGACMMFLSCAGLPGSDAGDEEPRCQESSARHPPRRNPTAPLPTSPPLCSPGPGSGEWYPAGGEEVRGEGRWGWRNH